jgi:hypothetical protein
MGARMSVLYSSLGSERARAIVVVLKWGYRRSARPASVMEQFCSVSPLSASMLYSTTPVGALFGRFDDFWFYEQQFQRFDG